MKHDQETVAPEPNLSMAESAEPRRGSWRFLAKLNATLGVLLWFGYCTDYSWAGTLADYFFPPVVAGVAAVSLWLFQRDNRPGVGAYAGGNGRVFVSVRYRWLPLVERDVFEVSRSFATKDTHEYVTWEGPDTLRIVGEPEGTFANQEIRVGLLAFRTPIVFSLPARIVSSFFR